MTGILTVLQVFHLTIVPRFCVAGAASSAQLFDGDLYSPQFCQPFEASDQRIAGAGADVM
ncbi:hypothetical protein [Chromohalobacter canadensis]|uniref:Uncharacterized protein n=1 Tax=Chromohalobacter canadensis TaxID=141389 RepID=A0ABZ0YFQ2_9GAMM|nr:hypothetical protein [Chromohalobacter canadensis]MCK0767199.1 hypothetical protein [Chromohalobacter canadensis]WQH10196.1 hypothetical protein SR908_05865 [Chromohalobacter canadensis]